jgi:quinol monooxygenase YgiN
MTYVVVALWKAKIGQEDTIAHVIAKMTFLSRQEPGVLQYQAHRSLSDSRLFLLYEHYVDEAAYQAHIESPHARQYALSEGIPNLESRERSVYELIDP